MAINKYFKIISPNSQKTTLGDNVDSTGLGNMYGNYGWYHRLVAGSPYRIQRYREYDLMDNDIDVSTSLDIMAEEIAGNNGKGELPLKVEIVAGQEQFVNTSQVVTLNAALRTWCNLHKWNTRVYDIARTTIKYGDCFYIRPRDKRKKYIFIHPENVYGAIVREDDFTEIEGWEFRLDYSVINSSNSSMTGYGISVDHQGESIAQIGKNDVVRFTMFSETDREAPFGKSVLAAIFRAFKQKELLEDSILIYRIQRAPEKRVFYVDVGMLPPQQRSAYLEKFKNDIKQRKVPSSYQNGVPQVESTYNPMSQQEDYFIGVRSDGSGAKVEVLPGGQNLGSLEDLKYFYDKMRRGLRIPESYVNSAAEGGGVSNDGKVGIAYLQEVKFSLYMERIQKKLEETFDSEFKKFLREIGVEVDTTIFKVVLPPPSNYEASRKQMMDADLLSNLSSADGIPSLSKQFILSKYGQLSKNEIKQNERYLRLEKGLNINGDERDLPKLYNPEEAELGGFEGGFGGSSGGLMGGGSSFGGDMDLGDDSMNQDASETGDTLNTPETELGGDAKLQKDNKQNMNNKPGQPTQQSKNQNKK